ncbi:MAG: hypothetical protein KMY55_04385 [Dethiosulfatibacter sp.]|nr:hypothetical protein [Dethiosulfatibacter sp.]
MSKMKIGIIVIVVLALVGTGIYMFSDQEDSFTEMSTFDKFEASLSKLREVKEADMMVSFNIDIDTSDPSMTRMADILQQVDFNYSIKQNINNIENPLIEGLLSLNYQQEPAFNLGFYMDAEKMILSSSDLISQAFYMNFEDYERYMNDLIASYGEDQQMPAISMDIQEIMKQSMEFQKDFYSLEGIEGAENFDGEKYRSMLEVGLEGLLFEIESFDVEILDNDQQKTVKSSGMQLDFNETQLIDLMLPMLEEAKTDDALKNIIIAKAEQYMTFVNTLYSIDYEAMGVEDPYAEIYEGIDDLDENYDIRIDEIIKALNDFKEINTGKGFSVSNKIGLDDSGMIIFWDMAILVNLESVNPSVDTVTIKTQSVTNSYNKSLNFTDYSNVAEEGIDLVSLFENPDATETQMVLMQLYGSVMQKMSLNPLFRDIMAETGVY